MVISPEEVKKMPDPIQPLVQPPFESFNVLAWDEVGVIKDVRKGLALGDQ